jgi:carbon storage regulator
MIHITGGYHQNKTIQGGYKMLVLSRRLGESLLIGDNITVKVLDMQGGQVRIGIEAPRNISVHREEVKQRIDSGEPRPH